MSTATEPFILTHSGRRVGVREGVPSLRDIAISLSRMPRFSGHGRVWWSVLDHSLYVSHLAESTGRELWPNSPNMPRALALAGLLHDAHESMTCDVPTPFKDTWLRAAQGDMDIRLMDAYFPGGYVAYNALKDEVKDLDRRALLSEARWIGPGSVWSDEECERLFGGRPLSADVLVLRNMARVDRENPTPIFLDRYVDLR